MLSILGGGWVGGREGGRVSGEDLGGFFLGELRGILENFELEVFNVEILVYYFFCRF